MENFVVKLVGVVFGIALILGIGLYNLFAWGLVVYYFWQWFLMDMFIALEPITLVQGMGIYLIMSWLKIPTIHIKEEYADRTKTITNLFLSPWVVLLMGYLLTLLM